ncbi:drug/metabolite transporter (DMT)-like permease [Deinococcus metalli]|uniref:Drug/metabolite transporter (DMT)-like permease n=1 Tax=Deinococcus metalli TaxID=1141878 RepID=A0A7W8NQN3_9DEIO|nr:DMT family transporter [Deinococcus metalli]MBB5376038.1 drug/metabolite transporter (DMT)-like permease [Deinococcus metalli]GHF41283.1 membrane protein [Deinococcus metalli]
MTTTAAPLRSDTRAGVGLGVVAAVAFSTLGVWGKLATQVGLDSHDALAWRFALVAALLLPLSGRLTWAVRTRLLGVGLLYTVATLAYFVALGRVTAGATSLLLYSAPAFVVLLAWGQGRAPRRTQLGAVALALLGLVLVIGLPGPDDRDAVGLLCGAAAGALYALYLSASERWLRGVSPVAATAHMALVAGVTFGALASVRGTLHVPDRPDEWGVIVGMAVIPTIVAVPALYGAIARLGATRASLLGTLEPLFTVLLAALLLREQVGAGALLGGALILAGAGLAQWPARRVPVGPHP